MIDTELAADVAILVAAGIIAAAVCFTGCAASQTPPATLEELEDFRAEQTACVMEAYDYDAGEACLLASDARWCAKHPELATGCHGVYQP